MIEADGKKHEILYEMLLVLLGDLSQMLGIILILLQWVGFDDEINSMLMINYCDYNMNEKMLLYEKEITTWICYLNINIYPIWKILQ